jgi:hypothetical protein
VWEFFQGLFDFNKTPLGLVGCHVLIHAKPATRQSWDFRAKPGIYIGPALDTYRCFKLVKTDTKSQVISDTLNFAIHTCPSLCLLWKKRSYTAYKLARVLSKVHHLPQVSPNLKQLLRFKKSLSHGACFPPPSLWPNHRPAPASPRVNTRNSPNMVAPSPPSTSPT